MSLTRKLLKELELNDAAIERIIAAHADTVDALRHERDEAREQARSADAALNDLETFRTLADCRLNEALSAQEELSSYRIQVEEDRHRDARRASLAEALASQGANPQVIPLLLDAITLPPEDWDQDSLRDPEASLLPWRTQYAPLFAVRTPVPVTRVLPPVGAGGTLTHADIQRMSPADINRNWSAVQAALRNGG